MRKNRITRTDVAVARWLCRLRSCWRQQAGVDRAAWTG